MARRFSGWRNAYSDSRVRRFWLLGIIALVIHGLLDPLVSYLAIAVFEVGREANPLIAPYFQEGLVTLILVHLPLYFLLIACILFHFWLFLRASETERQWLHRFSLIMWGLIIAWGLILVSNNLLVLVGGLR